MEGREGSKGDFVLTLGELCRVAEQAATCPVAGRRGDLLFKSSLGRGQSPLWNANEQKYLDIPNHVVIGQHGVQPDRKWLAPCLYRQAGQTTAQRAERCTKLVQCSG